MKRKVIAALLRCNLSDVAMNCDRVDFMISRACSVLRDPCIARQRAVAHSGYLLNTKTETAHL